VRSHKTLREIRSFVRRHTRLLELLGLLVVFITFVIKDGIRDQLKDRVSTLATSEASFLIRREISTVSHKIDELKPIAFEGTDDPYRLTEIEAREEIKRLKDSVSVYTSRTWFLIDTIPNNDALKKRISDINRRVDDFVGEAATAEAEAEAGTGPPTTNGMVSGKTVLTMAKGRSIQEEIEDFQWDVFAAADKAAVAAEGRYKVATRTSWMFYGLGWLLTFSARLLGVKGIEAGSG
jgi:hypothetical protein